jgi:cell division topological specificity factor
MGFLDYFTSRKQTANVAKERLSIIVAREGGRANGGPHYLPQLKQELLQVLAKYEKIDLEQVTVNVEKSGDTDVLELNVVLSPVQSQASRDPGSSWTPVPPAASRPPSRPLQAAQPAQPAWWERG